MKLKFVKSIIIMLMLISFSFGDALDRKIGSMANELQSVGVNYDLAPVVDLALNKNNYIIYGLGSEIELEPYKLLSNKADSVMVAHVLNAKLDPDHPASLSHATITKLLRWKLGYKEMVITDDLQIGAITKKYTLRETIKLAIKAGNDILLFGNQLHPKNAVTPQMFVDIVKDLLTKKEISMNEINKAHNRVEKLRTKPKGSNA